MKKHILINLFGTSGKRTVEITPRDGLSTRHIEVPRETGVPSTFAPVQEVAEQPPQRAATPVNPEPESDALPETPSLFEVLRWMAASENHTGWLIIDEILFVATTQYGMKFNQQSLLDALRLLYQEGCLSYRLNRFDQHMFRLIEKQETTLKALLTEVDALMDERGAS